MSTRSVIARTANGKTTAIYCHFDGYLEAPGVGATLHEHYQDHAKIDALIALGDLSELDREVAPADGQEHSFSKRAEGITTAYHRDRGEDWENTKPQECDPGEFMTSPPDMGQAYTYLHDGERWLVLTDAGWERLSDVLGRI